MRNLFVGLCLLFSVFIVSGCEVEEVLDFIENELEVTEEEGKQTESPARVSGLAEFIFFDIGQGDSSLIVGPQGETILIDTGRHDDDRILSLLEQENVQQIDLLVLTHPHADHIGNADKVIKKYNPTEIWMSGDEHTSKTFERVIDAALDSDADYHEPSVGETHEIGDFKLEIVSPAELTGDLNNGSIVFNLYYGETTILYTGDAERAAEDEMVNSGLLEKVDILKVGHHGSSTSSHDFFLAQIKPDVAIYSAAVDSEYGHPHWETVERLENIGAKIYGTPESGTVRVYSDGTDYEIETEY